MHKSTHAHTITHTKVQPKICWKLPLWHTQERDFPEIQSVFIEKKVRRDAWLYKARVGLVKFTPWAQPHVMCGGRGWSPGGQCHRRILWSGVQVCYCDNVRVSECKHQRQKTPKTPLTLVMTQTPTSFLATHSRKASKESCPPYSRTTFQHQRSYGEKWLSLNLNKTSCSFSVSDKK